MQALLFYQYFLHELWFPLETSAPNPSYGLTLIAAITILWYGISTMPSATTEYVYINEVVETVKEMPGLICNQISGCRVWWDKNGVEYCPTCVNK